MKKLSKKRAKIERELTKVYAQIDEERERCCAGCGRGDLPLEHSHRIPKRRRLDLICDPDNIDLMCRECHLLVEAGKWDLLIIGKEIESYIFENEPELYWILQFKNNPICIESTEQ